MRDALNGGEELGALGLERIDAYVVVNDEGQPEPEAADLNGLLLDVDAIQTILDDMRLCLVNPLLSVFADGIDVAIGNRAEETAQIDQFVEKADRKCS